VPEEVIKYHVDGRVGVITLNRPERANAQSVSFLKLLHEKFLEAAADDDVRVIVLRAEGRNFSSGHDYKAMEELPKFIQGRGLQDVYAFEDEVFYGYSRMWRDIPKPTIAAVQGAAAAAGLMLCWPCDLIIAADDARFGDPVIRMLVGVGVEYAPHTWEWGPRKAKELLMTGGFLPAEEAYRLGAVNRVVPRDRLDEETMALAHEIAEMDPFALRMAKRAVNMVQDIQGFTTSLQAILDMHWVCHSHGFAIRGMPQDASANEDDTGIPLKDLAAANRAQIKAAIER
jgi:enoyl-CoA hydratase